MTDLGTHGGDESYAQAVNEAAQMVGWSQTAEGDEHAVLWQDEAMTDLGTQGGFRSAAAAINDAGQIVGQTSTAAGERRAVLWSPS
jgi:probable HAF family extracellular repeat protein